MVRDARLRGLLTMRGLSKQILLARIGEFVEADQRDSTSPVPFAKIFRFTRRANHLYKFAPSHPTRGAYRDRHGRGVRMRWTRQRFARDGIAGRVGERPVSDHQASGREMLQRT